MIQDRLTHSRLVKVLFHVTLSVMTAVASGDETTNRLRLILPDTIDATAGIEANIYFDNVVLAVNPANYSFDVTCSKGRQQQERWTFLPGPNDVGNHPFVLEIRDESNAVIARSESTLRVTGAVGKANETSVLLIGDSLTNASVYSQRLIDLGKQSGLPISLVGSHGPGGVAGENRHEGYGGWTALRFATHFTGTAREGDYKQRGSPFLYVDGDSRKLDFARYCRDVTGGRFPDYVTIFLGPNDIFAATDENIEAVIDTMLNHYDQLIAMIREASSSTVIGAMLPVPPAASQDAFGANYANGQTRWQYKRNQHRLIERMVERYRGKEQDNIYLVATHLNLDCERNYPVEIVLPNAHATEKATRQNNGVHPAAAGYHQIGDSLFSWIRAHEAESSTVRNE